MVKFTISIFLLIFLFFGCGPNPADNKKAENSEEITENTYHILVFKKESRLEIWQAGIQNKFLDSFKINSLPLLPIGQFDLTFHKEKPSLAINFPNEFYRNKAYKIDSAKNLTLTTDNLPKQFFTKIRHAEIAEMIIFPNDNRLKGELTPCFGCPHWMAEIFAFLNLKKKEYN